MPKEYSGTIFVAEKYIQKVVESSLFLENEPHYFDMERFAAQHQFDLSTRPIPPARCRHLSRL